MTCAGKLDADDHSMDPYGMCDGCSTTCCELTRKRALTEALVRVQRRAAEVRAENIPGAPHRVAALDETAAWLAEEIQR